MLEEELSRFPDEYKLDIKILLRVHNNRLYVSSNLGDSFEIKTKHVIHLKEYLETLMSGTIQSLRTMSVILEKDIVYDTLKTNFIRYSKEFEISEYPEYFL